MNKKVSNKIVYLNFILAFLILNLHSAYMELFDANNTVLVINQFVRIVCNMAVPTFFFVCWKQMVWQQEKTISLKEGMMPRKMQLSFRLKKMNKVPSRLKSVQLDITSTWTYNTSKWT